MSRRSDFTDNYVAIALGTEAASVESAEGLERATSVFFNQALCAWNRITELEKELDPHFEKCPSCEEANTFETLCESPLEQECSECGFSQNG